MTRKTAKNIDNENSTCKVCSKAFSTQKGLRRHVMRNHRGTTFQCYYCDFTSKFKECISRHVPLHLVKKNVVRTQGAYVKCPLCEFGCVVRDTMIKHYEDVHEVNTEEQNIEFPNMEEFYKWKYYIEQADICQFTARSKKNRDSAQIRYYRCFRDGIFQKKGRGIRNMKLKGSLKMNGICPAAIKAEEDRTSGVVKVTCVRSHVGHSNELGLLNLSKSERAEIAEKIAMGMTHEDIIGSIRGSMDASIKRVHLTTRKDLWNVQSSYGLGKNKKKYVKNSKTTKANKNYDQLAPTVEQGSESLVAETNEAPDRNICDIAPPEMETILNQTGEERSTPIEISETYKQEVRCIIDTSGTHDWGIQCRTEPQESVSFYSAQSVPEKPMAQSYELITAGTVPLQHDHAGTEACDSSSDDKYFEMLTPDLPESGLVSLETQLDEKMNNIRSKFNDILSVVKTNEEADILYNELMRVHETIVAHSSLSGHFHPC